MEDLVPSMREQLRRVAQSKLLWRGLGLASCLQLALTTPAQGQTLELGGSLGAAARGSESSMVTSPWNPSLGVYASVLWTERLETTARVARVQQGVREGSAGYLAGCESTLPPCRPLLAFSIVERSKTPLTFITGSAQFNFRPRKAVRPFVGLGVEVTRNTTDGTSWGAPPSTSIGPAGKIRRCSRQR